MLNLAQMRPISSLPRDYFQLAEDTREGDIVFLKRNKPYVVFLDFDRWQKLIDLEEKSEEALALASIKQSEAEYRSGKAKVLGSLADI